MSTLQPSPDDRPTFADFARALAWLALVWLVALAVAWCYWRFALE